MGRCACCKFGDDMAQVDCKTCDDNPKNNYVLYDITDIDYAMDILNRLNQTPTEKIAIRGYNNKINRPTKKLITQFNNIGLSNKDFIKYCYNVYKDKFYNTIKDCGMYKNKYKGK